MLPVRLDQSADKSVAWVGYRDSRRGNDGHGRGGYVSAR